MGTCGQFLIPFMEVKKECELSFSKKKKKLPNLMNICSK